jgi:hypothetical protein
VKHSFAEAEPTKQRVENIFHPSPTGKSIERRTRGSKIFGDKNDVRIARGPCERAPNFGNVGGLSSIEAQLALGGQQSSGKPAHHFQKRAQALAGN